MCRITLPFAALLIFASAARPAEPWTALVDPDNSLSLRFLHAGQPVFRVSLGGWGPKWAWVGLQSKQKADSDQQTARVPFVVNKDAGEIINVGFTAAHPSTKQLTLRYDLDADKDVPLTLLIAGVEFEADAKGTLTLTDKDGKPTRLPLPIRGVRPGPTAAKASLAFDRTMCSENTSAVAPGLPPRTSRSLTPPWERERLSSACFAASQPALRPTRGRALYRKRSSPRSAA
jgi:hypothetical protein